MDIKHLKLEKILQSENLAEEFDNTDLNRIAAVVKSGYETDVNSRKEWEERMESAMKLALQVMEEKTFPWPKCANVKFPLITIAALQFSSRAYPALISDNRVVKTRVIGADPDGSKLARAEAISQHMSYQILEEDEAWEEEMDRLLIAIPIMGCAFKKSYFDSYKGHNVSECVHAWDLVVDYFARSIDTAARITHVIYRTPNEIKERMRGGSFLEFDIKQADLQQTPVEQTRNEIRGRTPSNDSNASHRLLEQHVWLDLDGDDYDEPYVVTYHDPTGKICRIIRRFENEDVVFRGTRVVRIKPHRYFTKYGFIPSPDGGFYDLGFGALLGPINETVNTNINQLIDAGTMATTGGGFLGRGIRIKGGKLSFAPNEWKKVEQTGDDLRKHIIPLPVREPSGVLFNLLGLLIQYGERISSVTDMMAGENPGQNQPATTSMAVLDQGMKIFSGIFKRIYRSMKEEFRKLYILNQRFLEPQQYFEIMDTGETGEIALDDYRSGDPNDIKPAADPNMIADSQRLLQAEALSARSMSVPGYNQSAVEKRYLEAMKIQDINEVYPTDEQGQPVIPAPPNPEIQTTMAELEFEREKFQFEQMEKISRLEMDGLKLDAEIMKIESTAILNMAKAEGEEAGRQFDQYKADLENMKSSRENLTKQIEAMYGLAKLEASTRNKEAAGASGGGA